MLEMLRQRHPAGCRGPAGDPPLPAKRIELSDAA